MPEDALPLVYCFSLLAALLFKHMLCDFPLQTSRMVAEKRYYGNRWGILHALSHGAATAIVLIVFSVPLQLILLIGLAETVFHYHLDWLKEQLTIQMRVQPNGRVFWFLIGADQMLHQFSYIVIVAWIASA